MTDLVALRAPTLGGPPRAPEMFTSPRAPSPAEAKGAAHEPGRSPGILLALPQHPQLYRGR